MGKRIESGFTINDYTQELREIILMEVFGLNILIFGDGVWIDKTTIELIKRGHLNISKSNQNIYQLIINLNYQNYGDNIIFVEYYNELLHIKVIKINFPVKLEQNLPSIIENIAIDERLRNMWPNENDYDK